MSHPLKLSLRVSDEPQPPGYSCLLLTVQNESGVKLLLPPPRITGLRFREVRATKDAKWRLDSEFCFAEEGFALRPGETAEFTFFVSDLGVVSKGLGGCGHFEERWQVPADAGDYDVVYRYRMEADGYYLDSHYDMAELRRKARSAGAEVWTGEAASNPVRVAFAGVHAGS